MTDTLLLPERLAEIEARDYSKRPYWFPPDFDRSALLGHIRALDARIVGLKALRGSIHICPTCGRRIISLPDLPTPGDGA